MPIGGMATVCSIPQAAAVRYAQEQGFARVLIVDWDIHHGDGTQSIFAA